VREIETPENPELMDIPGSSGAHGYCAPENAEEKLAVMLELNVAHTTHT